VPGGLFGDIEDLLDPTTAEGITFIAGSGFLDDDDQDGADGPPADACAAVGAQPTGRTTPALGAGTIATERASDRANAPSTR